MVNRLLCVLLTMLCCEAALCGVRIERGSVDVAGVGKLKSVTSVPEGASGKLPALLLAGWLSCDSVDSQDESDGFIHFLKDVGEQSGFIVMRVDKPGVGGSDGKCVEADFQSELAGYRAAWQALAARADVDTARMFVLGLSNGGGIAPLVAGRPAAAGFVAINGWSKTWFEHMMAIERRRLTLAHRTPAEVNARMRATAEFYNEYLNRRRAPRAILAERPALAVAWEGTSDTQYGRPAAFFQQLQALNLGDAWNNVKVPVLAMCGGQDWIMDCEDHRLIASAVNGNRAGMATFVEIPEMDHLLMKHSSMKAGFDGKESGTFAAESVRTVVQWLRAQAALP
ncbi:MAG TPA: alpha/beta hydrolase [Thermoanaerobaculia bacterium]|jgi:pimeloyl-ACP methyl ester carboxylesterase